MSMNEPQEIVRSVKETNQLLRARIVTEDTVDDFFWVGGMITRHYESHLGHQYFSIEDEDYTIECMLPNSHAGNASVPLSKGLVVDVYGVITFYERGGKVQIAAQKVRMVDDSAANIDPNVIRKLEENGLLPREKHPLPRPPQKIALLTSRRSEAMHDFTNTYTGANGTAPIELLDVLVQSDRAPQMIVDAIERVNQQQLADVIVIVRGGGRQADLATFNEYSVAEAICLSEVPIVTGIGHQQDDTIADRVADAKSNTPTSAAIDLAKLSEHAALGAPVIPMWLIVGMGITIIVLLVLLINQQL